MMKELTEEAGKIGFGTRSGKFSICGVHFLAAGTKQESLEEQFKKAHKVLVDRCMGLQEQKRAVKTEMQKNGGASLQRVHLWL